MFVNETMRNKFQGMCLPFHCRLLYIPRPVIAHVVSYETGELLNTQADNIAEAIEWNWDRDWDWDWDRRVRIKNKRT